MFNLGKMGYEIFVESELCEKSFTGVVIAGFFNRALKTNQELARKMKRWGAIG